jgi:hypothetical protein
MNSQKETLKVNSIIEKNYIVDYCLIQKNIKMKKGERSCPSGKPDFVVFDFIHSLFQLYSFLLDFY